MGRRRADRELKASVQESSLLGIDAIGLVKTFHARFSKVAYFYFKSYSPEPGVEERLDIRRVRTLAALSVKKLLEYHRDPRVLVAQMLRGTKINESKGLIEVRATELASALPDLSRASKARREVIAIYSLCRDKRGRELHIPMMDFRIESGSNIGQIALLKQALSTLEQKDGVLLDSGNSYHYYGFKLLSPKDWKRFMAASLLLEPLVDVRYIAHRLLANKAALRLSAGGRKPKIPIVTEILDSHVPF